MKAERLLAGPNTRFVVTNLERTPQSLYDENYVLRGDMENRIKEQQLMLFSDRTSCHDFLANQFRLLLPSFAYSLIETLRREPLRDTELEKAQVTTIRLMQSESQPCYQDRELVIARPRITSSNRKLAKPMGEGGGLRCHPKTIHNSD